MDKRRYIWLDGEEIEVSEDVYNEYMRALGVKKIAIVLAKNTSVRMIFYVNTTLTSKP